MNDNDAEDARSERHVSPPRYLDLDELKTKTGVLYWPINADTYENDEGYAKIRKDRGYSYSDLLEVSRNLTPDYEAKLKIFFAEHIHSDEEIRFVIDGCGYFDVRDVDDRWVRIKVSKGDLLVLPAGIYHRFILDASVSVFVYLSKTYGTKNMNIYNKNHIRLRLRTTSR